MDHLLDRPSSSDIQAPRVRRIHALQALHWLRRGLRDLMLTWRISLAYGLLITGIGLALLAVAWQATYLVPTLSCGFLLVAPFAALVMCALSQQIEARQPVDALAACLAWRRNAGQIAFYALTLALALIFWERLAAILFALSFGGDVPDRSQPLADLLFSGRYTVLLVMFTVAGALVAATVFAFSVVTMPLLLDRPLDSITAMLSSLQCCLRNPLAMLVWAALIAALMALGFATALLGLVLVFPWLGHASWHAYRDLVEPA